VVDSDACDWTAPRTRSAPWAICPWHPLVRRWGEDLIRQATKNSSTDFYGTKRVEGFPVRDGAIANDSGAGTVKNDGSPSSHQYVNLTRHQAGRPLHIERGGYLHCFANDAWSFYENNRGCIRLTVTRTR
jgi:hypothetical protein